MKHKSTYAQKLSRRVSAGNIHYSLPVRMDGHVCAGPSPFCRVQLDEHNQIKTRSLSRLRRADEI